MGSNYREQNSFSSRSSSSMRGMFSSFYLTISKILSQVTDYAYPSAENQARRSTSGPSGPSLLPSSALSGLSTEEREVARQRRRALQESRRQSKNHVRRTRLPSASDSRSSKVQEIGHSIDSFTASSNASSYDMGNAPYGRTNSVSSTQGPYMGGISS